MKLSHYTATPLRRVRSVEQEEKPAMKPRGLWLSVDGEDDWRQYCIRDRYKAFDAQRLRYRVTLHMARMVVLSTVQELDNFTRFFSVDLDWQKGMSVPNRLTLPIYIDWLRVAQKAAGIIITPYQWTRRLELPWYYGWDCASGCVWDAAAVLSVRQLKSVRPRRRKSA